MARRRRAQEQLGLPLTFDLAALAPAIRESAALHAIVQEEIAKLDAREQARASAIVGGELSSRRPAQARRFTVRGDVRAVLFEGKAGESRVLSTFEQKNIVVNGGLNYLRDFPFNSATALARMGWGAIGSGAAAPAPTDAALGTETARVAMVYAAAGTGVCTITATFPAGTGTGTVAEAGIFNNAGAGLGTMFDRFLVGPMTKAAGNELVVTVTLTFTAI